jgi:transcriptional regulator with XRE-family HTH domain
MQPHEILKKNILKSIEKLGWSQNRLAKEAGLYQPQISKWLNGEQTPGLDSLDKLAQTLGIDVADLLREDSEPTPRVIKPTPEEALEIIRKALTAAKEPKGIPTLPGPIFDLLKRMRPEDESAVANAIRSALQRQRHHGLHAVPEVSRNEALLEIAAQVPDYIVEAWLAAGRLHIAQNGPKKSSTADST